MKLQISVLLFLLGCHCLSAQKIDNTPFYRNVSSGRSLRLHYENDFFSRSDLYYTQGINLEYYNPSLVKYFERFLLKLRNAKISSGVAIEHLGYTPSSISSSDILVGDRPFAACFLGKVFTVSHDSASKTQVSSTLSLGVIGPAAGGKQFQSAIHRWINDRQPKGWNYQISNDLIINYNLGLVKTVLILPGFTLAGKVSADLGTATTKANAGLVLMGGLFEDRWNPRERKFQVYVYAEPIGSLIGYDATLQGGIFNRSSPYTIASNDVAKTVLQNNSGIIFVIRKLQLEYFQSFATREFTGAKSHHWGGVRVGLEF